MRILVVEDESVLREALRMQFVKAGFTVDVAQDGEEGLYAGTEYPVDVAIVDLGLPKIPGLELIRKLRAQKANPCSLISQRIGAWSVRLTKRPASISLRFRRKSKRSMSFP